MLRKKKILIILLFLIIYFIISFYYNKYIINANYTVAYVAKVEQKRGEKLNKENFEKIYLDKTSLLKDGVLTNIEDIKNKVINENLKKGEILKVKNIVNEKDIIVTEENNELLFLDKNYIENFLPLQFKNALFINIYYNGDSSCVPDSLKEDKRYKIISKNNKYITVRLLEKVKIVGFFDERGKIIEFKDYNSNKIQGIVIEVADKMVTLIKNLSNYGNFYVSVFV